MKVFTKHKGNSKKKNKRPAKHENNTKKQTIIPTDNQEITINPKTIQQDIYRTNDTRKTTSKQRHRDHAPSTINAHMIDIMATTRRAMLNRINIQPNTRHGRQAILESSQGIGSKQDERNTNTATITINNTDKWFAPFIDEYIGCNPIFKMTINNKELRCLLDTGAGVNLIGSTTLGNIMPEYRSRMTQTITKARDVQKKPVKLEGKILLTTKFGGKTHNIEFEIITNTNTLILGNKYIYDMDALILGREGFGSRNNIHQHRPQATPKTYNIYATQDTLIEKGGSANIKCNTRTKTRQWAPDINKQFLIDPGNNNIWTGHPTLTTINADGQMIAVLSSQIAPHDITIDEGTWIGTATTDFEDGEEIITAIMAEMSDIQTQINHINAENIIGQEISIDNRDTEINPPGFELDGPKQGSIGIHRDGRIITQYDTQRENQGATPESAHIHATDKSIQSEIRRLLRKHKKMFSTHNYDIGHFCIDGQVQKVKLTISDRDPIVEKYRNISPAKKQAAEQILTQLENSKIITRKASGWASQAVWVTKALPELTPERAKELNIEFIPGSKDPTGNRNLRFCQDYRALNSRLQSVQWPLPSVKTVLSRLANTKYVTVLDASHSFYCIELDEESKLYTGFQSCDRNYVMNRLAMGLKCSSGILNACLARTLQGQEQYTIPYSDNILIISKTAKEHTKHLGLVMEALEDHGWKFKAAKCHFAVNKTLKVFGMQINLQNGTIAPDPCKVQALKDMPLPTKKTQLRSYLGGLGYFSECLPDIGEATARLHNLTKTAQNSGQTITWTTEDKEAFEKINEILEHTNVIHMPEWKKPMHLVVDAGPQHTSSMLVQLDKSDKWIPLGFWNKKLSERECSLSQIEKEALAIIYGLRQTSHYVSHTKVYIHSDNKPFVLLKKYATQNTKLSRWKLFLDSFDHVLVWEPSTTPAITFVDFLSRPPSTKILNRKITDEDLNQLPTNMPEGIYTPQQYDQLLDEILNKEEIRPTKQMQKAIDIAATETTPNNTRYKSHSPQEIATRIAQLSKQQRLTLGNPSRTSAVGNKSETPEEALIEIIITDCPYLNLDKLRELQKNCSVLGPIYKHIDQHPEFTIHKDILLRKFVHGEINRILLAVPVFLADDLVSDIHRGSATCHTGQKKLLQLIRTRYFIPQIRKRIKNCVENCGLCEYYKPRKHGGQRPNSKRVSPRGPGDMWAMDHIQITSKPDDENRTSLLCFVDLYSHFLVCKPVGKTLTAKQAATIFLEEIIARFGVPRLLLSDNGPDMDSELWREMANLFTITKVTIAPGSAKSNGITEKVQGLILAAIRNQAAQYRIKPDRFADLAIWATLAHNATPYKDLEPPLSPAEIFLGRNISEASFFSFANAAYAYRNLEEFNRHMVAAQMTISEIIGARKRYLDELDEKKKIIQAPYWDFPEGTLVALKDKTQATKEANIKLRPRYKGVFIVIKQTTTSCLIRAFSSETILEDMENEHEAPRGRGKPLPRYKIRKADKNDLKKLKHLVFYSLPLAKKFTEHLSSQAPEMGKTFDVLEENHWDNGEDIPMGPPDPEDEITYKRKRTPSNTSQATNIEEPEPLRKILRIATESAAPFPFEYE